MPGSQSTDHSKGRHVLFAFLLAVLVLGASWLYLVRSTRCVLFYYGASPVSVLQGKAIAVLNPLRSRKDEGNAERLIGDLRTGECEKIARERLSTDPSRICQVMRGNKKASLIWLGPESDKTKGGTRELIYDLSDMRARLIVYFGVDEAGWGVKTVSVVE